MISTCHILVGAAIASKIPSIPLGLAAAFFSHYLIDFIPHYEYPINQIRNRRWLRSIFDFLKITLDLFLGFALIFLFAKPNIWLFAAAILAIVPDGFTLLQIIFPENKLLKKIRAWHSKVNEISEKKKIPASLGILLSLIVALIALLFL
jgi:hypothetical protein